jgi:undecaprenyl-diphosphatase
MNWFEAIILGIIQGLTEFLPVSSSGHLEIAKAYLGVDKSVSLLFTVAVHGATVLSTIFVFWKEILTLFEGTLKFRTNEESSYVLKIFFSMIPVAVAGLFFKEPIEQLFDGNLLFIGLMLLVTALVLAIAHFIKKDDRSIGFPDAFIIGLAQALAVVPGISRSGMTIAAGLMIGNKKEEIAKFSFLMVLIPIIGANIIEITSGHFANASVGIGVIMAGFISAFVTGYIACKMMINLVKKSKLIGFSIYCAVVGLLLIFFN